MAQTTKMWKLVRVGSVALAALLMIGAAHANAIYVLAGPDYSGNFIVDSSSTLTPVGGSGVYTGIQQQDKLWDDFNFGNLPVGTLFLLSFATVGGQDVHTITFSDPFSRLGKSFSWSYDISVTPGPPPFLFDVASDLNQTRGVATLKTVLVDNFSNGYLTDFTQTGTSTTGITTANFVPGVVMLAVNDTLTLGPKGSDVSSVANSYTQTAVPEPASLGLLGSGLACLSLVLRRRRI